MTTPSLAPEARPPGDRGGVDDVAATSGPISDRITGAPVWAGFAIALATWILFEVILLAVGLVAVSAGPEPAVETAAWWWSLVAAVLALFVGGLVAGAASRWRTLVDGLMQGITVWAVTVLAVLLLSAAGAGIGFGALGSLLAPGRIAAGGITVPPGAVEAAQNAAAIATLVLLLIAAAAAAGGAVGVRLWPRRPDGHRARQG